MRLFLLFLLLAQACFAGEWIIDSQADFLSGTFQNTSAASGSVLLSSHEDWVQWGNNPVFDPATKAYYPTVIYDPNRFSSHGAAAYYKMWYNDGSGISLAISDDGINWTIVGQGSGLTNPNHARVLYDEGGFGGSGVYYKIWYWDESKLYEVGAIRYAESQDGLSWVNDQPITQDDSRKIITGQWPDWNRGSYGPGYGIYNESGSAEINHSNPFANRYVMYYDGTDGGFEETGLAYSNDGKNWSFCCKVLERGGGPWGNNLTWDSSYAFAWSVLRTPRGFELWYSGGQKASYEGIGYAISDDGMNFTKSPDNPIKGLARTPGAWNEERSYTPMVIYDANNFSGHGEDYAYKMWLSGRSGGNYAIGYARLGNVYEANGSYISKAFDAGSVVNFTNITWDATLGGQTNITLRTRTSVDNVGWSDWSSPRAYPSDLIENSSARFIQFMAELSTSDPSLTPSLNEVRIAFAGGGAPPAEEERERKKAFIAEVSGECLLEPVIFEVRDGLGEPIRNVRVRVLRKDAFWEVVAEVYTGRNGEARFTPQATGMYEAEFSSPGYYTQSIPFVIGRCAECYADSECREDQACVGGTCTAIQCACGRIEGRQCIPYECCSDAECGSDERCSDNSCVKITGECGYARDHTWVRYECCSDAECGSDERCSGNSCVKITGECGYARDHRWIKYECCSDEDCGAGLACSNHTCIRPPLPPSPMGAAFGMRAEDIAWVCLPSAILLALALALYLLLRRWRGAGRG